MSYGTIPDRELVQYPAVLITEPIPPPTLINPSTNHDCLYDNCSDEQLVKHAEYLEEMLEEMRVWDAEDVIDKAMGRTNVAAQPYQESADFKELT